MNKKLMISNSLTHSTFRRDNSKHFQALVREWSQKEKIRRAAQTKKILSSITRAECVKLPKNT